ncbi:MAG: lipocalin family protein [Acidobacteriota bacterium]
METLSTWTSEKTGAEYPRHWRVSVESLGIDLEIEPLVADQKLDTRGSTMIVYWEGACKVSGDSRGEVVTGRAYIELSATTGRTKKPASRILFGSRFRRIQELFG